MCVRHDKEVERSTDGDYCDQTHWGNWSDLWGLKLSGLQLNMEYALKRFLFRWVVVVLIGGGGGGGGVK